MAGREARFCSPIYFSALPLEVMTRELASARWETKVSGLVALTRDWAGPGLPPLSLNPPARLALLARQPLFWTAENVIENTSAAKATLRQEHY